MKKLITALSLLFIFSAGNAQNFDFEFWTADTLLLIDGYANSVSEFGSIAEDAVQRSSDKVSANYSIRLETQQIASGDTIFGYIANGDPGTLQGGEALNSIGRADSIIGYYKYDVPAGDTALLMVVPKYNGTLTGQNLIKLTGTQSTWQRFSYPTNNFSPNNDTVIFAAASSNAFSWPGIPGSYLMLDSVSYKESTGNIENIYNHSFEIWNSSITETPDDWRTTNDYVFSTTPNPAVKTTDAYSGSYALELNTVQNANNDTLKGVAVVGGQLAFNTPGAGYPYTGQPTNIDFYYKTSLTGTDTARAYFVFKNNGTVINFYGNNFTSNMSSYTQWMSPVSLGTNPDTVEILLEAGANPGSQFKVDAINFSYPVGVTDKAEILHLVAFPNPVINKLNIQFNIKEKTDVSVEILDGKGSAILSKQYGNMTAGKYIKTIDIGSISSGIYFYRFTTGDEVLTEKFIKK